MKEGEIVLASILTSDGKFKKRPSLILKILPKYRDLLLCGVSSQIYQYLADFDLMIDVNLKDFPTSGLIKDSIIRLRVVPKTVILNEVKNLLSFNSNRLESSLRSE